MNRFAGVGEPSGQTAPPKVSRPMVTSGAVGLRLCLVGHRHLSRLAYSVLHEFEGRARVEVVDGAFDAALDLARRREQYGSIDAFVSAGANAAILRGAIQTPVATIKVSGFDLLVALQKARQVSDRVGVVTYRTTIEPLDAIRALLKIDIEQRAYRTPDEARRCFDALAAAGVQVIVGSSVVVELAEQHGLTGILSYSPDGVRQGIEDGIELARAARLEAARSEQLGGVLHSLQEAVLAVDDGNRVIAVNPRMEQLLGRTAQSLLGRSLEEVEPELSLRDVIAGGVEQRGQVVQFARRTWIANRSPIRQRNEIAGATVALYDARAIEEADTSLRSSRKGSPAPKARYTFDHIVAKSAAMAQAVGSARRCARTDLTVLIAGESGTGKELFAQAIHNASSRADRPFIAVNCAAFPEALLESELFGYEEGAFTGSRRGGKRGLIEAAHTGTLLLDEIGDMPLSLQSRLLRVLQEREVVRLGALSPIPVDVRVIAATHQPLAELVKSKRFRQDLYYRINLLQVTLPPMRDRREEVVDLAERLLARSIARLQFKADVRALLAPLAARIEAYRWPGNVRELENVCERLAVYVSQGGSIRNVASLRNECPELFTGSLGVGSTQRPDPSAQRRRVTEALIASGGNRQEAARRLGMSRATLWRYMRKMSHETSGSAS